MKNSIPSCIYGSLRGIDPIGLGSASVESMVSFMARVAAFHGYTTGKLIDRFVSLALGKHYLTEIAVNGGTGFYKSSAMVLSCGKAARDFCRAMEVVTGQVGLEALTMLPWSEVVALKGIIYPRRRWCPVCYYQQLREEEPVRDLLLWALQTVTVCPTHGVWLHSLCPHCGRSAFHLDRWFAPGYCSNCGCWLGMALARPELLEHYAREIWLAKQSSFLLATATEPHIVEGLLAASLRCCENMCRLSYATGIPKTTLFGWFQEGRKPTLVNLFELSWALRLSLVSPTLLHEQPRSPKYEPKAHKVRMSGLFQENETGRRWEQKILAAVADRYPPPSFCQVAKELKVSPRLLRWHTPDLCRSVSAQYLKYRGAKKECRHFNIKNRLRLTFRTIVYSGQYPGRRLLETLCDRPAMLRERQIKVDWNDCFGPIVD